MRRRHLLSLPAIAATLGQARAQSTWRAATEYPAGAMPAEGLSRLAAAARAGAGLAIEPAFDAPEGIRSAGMPGAVTEGRFAIGDAFAGALGGMDPVFLLSSLPFLATSASAARRLLEAARPAYAEALGRQGLEMLHATPWPPTGLWSRRPISRPADLRDLRLRTYDASGTETFRRLGAAAEVLSFQDVAARLANGSLDAVLSSGDGGAGRRLWDHLPHFCEIGYAMPISLAFASRARLDALPGAQRQGLLEAARSTEEGLWELLKTREAANQARMLANGMAISGPAPELAAALREAGAEQVEAWAGRAGPAGAAVLARYRRMG